MAPRNGRSAAHGASDRLREAYARLEALLELTADAVVTIDSHGVIDTFNRAAERMLGYTAQEVIGRNVSILMPEPHASEHDAHLDRYLRTGESHIIGVGRKTVARHRDGSEIPIALAVTESRIGGRRLFTGVLRDLSGSETAHHLPDSDRVRLEVLVAERTAALLESNRRLELLAATDPLTGLANRRRFDEVLEREVLRASRTAAPLALILCDLDCFKQYNDTYGHPAGDACLQTVATVMQRVFRRAMDLPARYGGEEFAIVLPDVGLDQAVGLAEKLRSGMWDTNLLHERSPVADRVTLSAGVAVLDGRKSAHCGALVADADAALYRAKQAGRNQVWPAARVPLA